MAKIITKTVSYTSGHALYVDMPTLKIQSFEFAVTGNVLGNSENTLSVVRAKYETPERRIISAVGNKVLSDRFGMNELEFKQNGFLATKEEIKAHKDGGKIMFRSFPIFTISVTTFNLVSKEMRVSEYYVTDISEKTVLLQYARDNYETGMEPVIACDMKEREDMKIGMNESTFLEKAHKLSKEELECDEAEETENDEENEEKDGE